MNKQASPFRSLQVHPPIVLLGQWKLLPACRTAPAADKQKGAEEALAGLRRRWARWRIPGHFHVFDMEGSPPATPLSPSRERIQDPFYYYSTVVLNLLSSHGIHTLLKFWGTPRKKYIYSFANLTKDRHKFD